MKSLVIRNGVECGTKRVNSLWSAQARVQAVDGRVPQLFHGVDHPVEGRVVGIRGRVDPRADRSSAECDDGDHAESSIRFAADREDRDLELKGGDSQTSRVSADGIRMEKKHARFGGFDLRRHMIEHHDRAVGGIDRIQGSLATGFLKREASSCGELVVTRFECGVQSGDRMPFGGIPGRLFHGFLGLLEQGIDSSDVGLGGHVGLGRIELFRNSTCTRYRNDQRVRQE